MLKKLDRSSQVITYMKFFRIRWELKYCWNPAVVTPGAAGKAPCRCGIGSVADITSKITWSLNTPINIVRATKLKV